MTKFEVMWRTRKTQFSLQRNHTHVEHSDDDREEKIEATTKNESTVKTKYSGNQTDEPINCIVILAHYANEPIIWGLILVITKGIADKQQGRK